MSLPNVAFKVTGAGASPVYTCNNFAPYFNVGYGTLISATATYSIQYTFDDVTADGYNPSSGNWFVVSGASSITTATSGTFTIPCRGIRLNVSSSTGTVTLQLQQAGTQ